MIIYKEFQFDSAHFLSKVPDGHPCKQLHGHTYTLKIFLKGNQLKEEGWLMDFKELKTKVLNVISPLDHNLLNNIDGLDNPTSELLAIWIWNKLKPTLPLLSQIELQETPTSGVIYEGE